MRKVITTESKPIMLWTDDYQEKALEQAKNMANHPFTFRNVACMADMQPGYGVPIGGVWATQGAILPFAVGSDIGCGVRACRIILPTDLTDTEIRAWAAIVRRRVPVGPKSRDESIASMESEERGTMFTIIIKMSFGIPIYFSVTCFK